MIIALPLANNQLSMHFGHCECFALFDVDSEKKRIIARTDKQPPPHEPGVLPKWLAEQGAAMIIAGGMGQRAHHLFTEQGIRVITGAPAATPETLVTAYLNGTLTTGSNVCDH